MKDEVPAMKEACRQKGIFGQKLAVRGLYASNHALSLPMPAELAEKHNEPDRRVEVVA
jgi:hypothetical protein